jgi:long-chain acyl-CoA synthetase
VLKELSKHTFHSFPAVNTLFNGWPTTRTSTPWTGSHLKVSVGGGMAVQRGGRLWLEKTGCPICEGYGLSETSPSASCNPVDQHRVHRHHRCAPAQHLVEAARRRRPRGAMPGQPGEIASRARR